MQGIPAVYALQDGKVVDGFVGAQGEAAVARVRAPAAAHRGGDRAGRSSSRPATRSSLRQALELEPGHHDAIVALAELLVDAGDRERRGAGAARARSPRPTETRRVAALARTGADELDDVEARLDALLERVRDDEEARQEYLDLLELLGPDDPRTASYRKALTSRLF